MFVVLLAVFTLTPAVLLMVFAVSGCCVVLVSLLAPSEMTDPLLLLAPSELATPSLLLAPSELAASALLLASSELAAAHWSLSTCVPL